jgi:hypothetical protein
MIANKSAKGERIAVIPEGTVVQMMPFIVKHLQDVTLRIDGAVLASTHWKHWPLMIGPDG